MSVCVPISYDNLKNYRLQWLMSHVWLQYCVVGYSRGLDRSVRDSNAHTMNNSCITESLQERGVDVHVSQ